MSFTGSLIGFAYGFALGFLVGYAVPWLYNRLLALGETWAKRRADDRHRRLPGEHPAPAARPTPGRLLDTTAGFF